MTIEYYVVNRHSRRQQLASQLLAIRTNASSIAAIVYMHSWYRGIEDLNPRVISRRAHDRPLLTWIVERAERIRR